MSRRFVAIALILVFGSIAAFASVRLDRRAAELDSSESLLYLPNGKYLKAASMGQSSLVADLIYLWAIQYYAVYEREDRYRYVEHIFSGVITELDPHYTDAYWMGALILIVEGQDLEAGLRILERGMELNPDSWMLPYLAGWECFHAASFDRAETFFERAESIPGVPSYVRRTRIGMASKSGDHRRAYSMWLEVLRDPDADATTVRVAERQLRHLKVKIDIQEMESWVVKFRVENGRNPRSVRELVSAGYADAVPLDPFGREYSYDMQSGRVTAADGRIVSEGS